MADQGDYKMTIKSEFIEELKIIDSVFNEKVTIVEMKEAVKESVQLAREHNTNLFLVDCSRLKKGGTIVQLYSLGDFYLEIDVMPGTKQAIVLSDTPETQRDIRFYETAMRNRGFDVQVFPDRPSAIAWLLHE
jgi:hypothetical protein